MRLNKNVNFAVAWKMADSSVRRKSFLFLTFPEKAVQIGDVTGAKRMQYPYLILPKRSMVRIVRSPNGVVIDPTGKLAGRGAYLHDLRSCWEVGMKGALASALKAELTPDERERLMNYAVSLPDKEPIMNE